MTKDAAAAHRAVAEAELAAAAALGCGRCRHALRVLKGGARAGRRATDERPHCARSRAWRPLAKAFTPSAPSRVRSVAVPTHRVAFAASSRKCGGNYLTQYRWEPYQLNEIDRIHHTDAATGCTAA